MQKKSYIISPKYYTTFVFNSGYFNKLSSKFFKFRLINFYRLTRREEHSVS